MRLALLVGYILLLALPASSHAGGYVVRTCSNNLVTPRNVAWTFTSNASAQFEAAARCEAGAGLSVEERLNPPDSTGGMYGRWSVQAPATTRITALSLDRLIQTEGDPDFRAGLLVDGASVDECALAPSAIECSSNGTNGFETLSAQRLDFGVRCVAPEGTSCVHGASIHSATAIMRGSTITFEDPVPPTVSAPTGTLFSGGWLRGPHTAQTTGSDATGVRSFSLLRDGEPAAQDPQTCDYGALRPCALPGEVFASEFPAVDTAAWSDGVHQVVARVTDSGENQADSTPVEVKTDNTPPAAPARVRNGREGIWANRRNQRISWTAPAGQASPVTGSTVSACKGRKKPKCVQVSAATAGGARVRLPGEGLFSGRVFLRDEAGNASEANAAVLKVGYDRSKPNRPRLARTKRGARVRIRDNGAAPIAKLAARLCRPGTAKRCRTLKTKGLKRITARAKGRSVLRVRVVDAAGNRSSERALRLRG